MFDSQLITAICHYPKKSEVYGVINGWVYVHADLLKFFALSISVLLSGQLGLYISLQMFVLLYQNPDLKSETLTGFSRCLSALQGPPTPNPTVKWGLPSATPVLQSEFTAHPCGFKRPKRLSFCAI